MSAVMHDAVGLLTPDARAAYGRGALADIVYADDTLLVGASSKFLHEFLRAVAAAGHAYGLELHEDKFQLLQINCKDVVRNVSLDPINASSSLSYLGATLSSDGRAGSELSRRIGAAKADFRSLCKVWRHSSLTRAQKLKVYRALVESKLMYALSTCCFVKAELRRLDGFQSKCLRVILGILPSYLSHVSKAAVREKAGWTSASAQLLQQQMMLLGKVLRAEPGSTLQRACFIPGTLQPVTDQFVRKVGRPRKEWVTHVLPNAVHVAGGQQQLRAVVQNASQWKRLV